MSQEQPNAPRIDDFLALRYQHRIAIEELLRNALAAGEAAPHVAALARRAAEFGEEVPAILLDLSLNTANAADDLGNLALLVLGELDNAETEELIERRLQRAPLETEEKLRLLTIKTFLNSDPASVMNDLAEFGEPLELLEQITGHFWDQLSPAEMAVMWIEKFSALGTEEKLALMEMFMRVAKKDFPAIARIESGAGDHRIDRFVAEALADFPYPDSITVLHDLANSTDTPTRLAADHSLNVLRQDYPDLQAAPPEEGALAGGKPYKAWIARDEPTDQTGVVLSRISEADGVTFCVALIDMADHGIVDLWGNAGFTPEEFEDLIRTLNAADQQDEAAWVYHPAEPAWAMEILRKAETKTRQQPASHLPPGFHLWSLLWR